MTQARSQVGERRRDQRRGCCCDGHRMRIGIASEGAVHVWDNQGDNDVDARRRDGGTEPTCWLEAPCQRAQRVLKAAEGCPAKGSDLVGKRQFKREDGGSQVEDGHARGQRSEWRM